MNFNSRFRYKLANGHTPGNITAALIDHHFPNVMTPARRPNQIKAINER
jgi:hypothetical protein